MTHVSNLKAAAAAGIFMMGAPALASSPEPDPFQGTQLPPVSTELKPSSVLPHITLSAGERFSIQSGKLSYQFARSTYFGLDEKKFSFSLDRSQLKGNYNQSIGNEPLLRRLDLKYSPTRWFDASYLDTTDKNGRLQAFDSHLALGKDWNAAFRTASGIQNGKSQDTSSLSLSGKPDPKSAFSAEMSSANGTQTNIVDARTKQGSLDLHLNQRSVDNGTASIRTTSADFTTPTLSGAFVKTGSATDQTSYVLRTAQNMNDVRFQAEMSGLDTEGGASTRAKRVGISSLKPAAIGDLKINSYFGGFYIQDTGDVVARQEFTGGLNGTLWGAGVLFGLQRVSLPGQEDQVTQVVGVSKNFGTFQAAGTIKDRGNLPTQMGATEQYNFKWGMDRLSSLTFATNIYPEDPTGKVLPRRIDSISYTRKLSKPLSLTFDASSTVDSFASMRDLRYSAMVNGLFPDRYGLQVGYSYREWSNATNSSQEHGIKFSMKTPQTNGTNFRVDTTLGIQSGGKPAVGLDLFYSTKF